MMVLWLCCLSGVIKNNNGRKTPEGEMCNTKRNAITTEITYGSLFLRINKMNTAKLVWQVVWHVGY